MFQLQVVRYNFNQKKKAKCNADNFNQIPQFIVGDIVWDTNPVIFLIVYQLYTIQMEPYNALTFAQHTLT